MAKTNKQTGRNSNISLNRSTTYSGADIKVFIYRDLVDLKNSIDKGGSSSRDGTVMLSEETGRSSLDDRRSGLTDGGTISRGQQVPQKDILQKQNPTNIVDLEYNDNKDDVSNFLREGSRTGDLLGSMGINDVIAELGSLYAVNYSSFREKAAVRTLGRTHARNYTRGQRTIAGTMVFNVLQSHELLRFGNAVGDRFYSMLDQLEPFNLILLFTNEYGAHSVLHLFNVDINTESQAMSIDDLLLTNTMNFYCQDMLPMEDVGNMFNSTAEMLHASVANHQFESFMQQMQKGKLSGLNSLNEALKGGAGSDTRIQKLLKRSRGLF